MTFEELKEVLRLHAPTLSRKLHLIGACAEARKWVDTHTPSSIEEALAKCERDDWRDWLRGQMGQKPTSKGLDAVVDFLTGGQFETLKGES